MSKDIGHKTAERHWDSVWQSPVRPRLPSRLNVGILNITRLLQAHVQPGDRYIEIGCAPGKLLAWVASVLKADVAGLDYSETGIAQCRALFDALRLKVDLYRDDFFNHSLSPTSFDIVSSFGLIEHFDDPSPVVQRHIDLLRPGGLALITVPNYGGLYGALQRWCDAPNLALHNIDIMSPQALTGLVKSNAALTVKAHSAGVVSPWVVNLERRLPASLAKSLSLGVNALGLMQPFHIKALAPMLVLAVRKNSPS